MLHPFLFPVLALSVVLHVGLPLASANDAPTRPNIVFIITDDQDLHLNSLDYMPFVKKYITEEGTTFARHYCTIALCCPSRVSLWTGKAAHNTNVTSVSPPYGGYPQFIKNGLNDNYFPIWLGEAGYNSYYVGKMMNGQSTTTYNQPFIKGWTGSDFLLDPGTYQYTTNFTFQRNQDPPVTWPSGYNTDEVARKTYGFLDDAVAAGKPFFLASAPMAPHGEGEGGPAGFAPPVSADRHKDLFKDVKIPRSVNFNAAQAATGPQWMKDLPILNEEKLEYFDEWYRLRLRALQAVDEMVEGVIQKLEKAGLLDNTYVIYTTDNGYHIGNHRMGPGKLCGYEEDVNIPFIVRGPGVKKNATTDLVTSHTDLAPTFLSLIGEQPRPDFDGIAFPVAADKVAEAERGMQRQEHVNIEFWGGARDEGRYTSGIHLNTYKSIRLISKAYNIYYSVWCTGERELYDMSTDPGQVKNLIPVTANSTSSVAGEFLGRPLQHVLNRLDALTLVLKSCKGSVCILPWKSLHRDGSVMNLKEALSEEFDSYYEQLPKVKYETCALGQLLENEKPLFTPDLGL